MKDCKWNPPTAGYKGLHFDSRGDLMERQVLQSTLNGERMLKFLDESGSRKARRTAARQIARWQEDGTYLALLEGKIDPPAGWVLHIRDVAEDPRGVPLDILMNSKWDTSQHVIPDSESYQLSAIATSLYRQGRLGVKDLAHAVWYSDTPFPERWSHASQLTANPTERFLLSINADNQALSCLDPADPLLQAKIDLFTKHGLNTVRMTAAQEFVGAFSNPTSTTSSMLNGLAQHADPASACKALNQMAVFFDSRLRRVRLGDVADSPLDIVTACDTNMKRHALQLALGAAAIDGTGRVTRASEHNRILEDLAELADKNGLCGSQNVFSITARKHDPVEVVAAVLHEALIDGVLAGPDPQAALAYLTDPTNEQFKTPRVALLSEADDIYSNNEFIRTLEARGLATRPTPPLGHVDLRHNIESPSAILKANERNFDQLLRHEVTGLYVSETPQPAELALAAGLAVLRHHGHISSEQGERLDAVVMQDRFSDIARDALAKQGISEDIKARLASNTLRHDPSAIAPADFTKAVTGLLIDGTFDLDTSATAAHRVVSSVLSEQAGSAPRTWRDTLDDIALLDPDSAARALEEGVLLAKTRAANGRTLGVAAVPFIRQGSTSAHNTASIALEPTVDPSQVIELIKEHAPLLSEVVVREGEIAIPLNEFSAPAAALETLDSILVGLNQEFSAATGQVAP